MAKNITDMKSLDEFIRFTLDEELLEKLNRYTRKPVSAQEVYTFPVILCDNEIDRDGERFSVPALERLAELFVGKTGIFDHDPKGENQTARIFDCEVKTLSDRLTAAGEPYTCLVAKAYMMRTDRSKDLIAEIEGGIKKEVSVGCSVGRKLCSVCGADLRENPCGHIRGKYYNGKLCSVILDEPTDAYEWSFVAVPAQRNAGVTKSEKLINEFKACKRLASAVIMQAYHDIENGGDLADRTVIEVEKGGLDIYLNMLDIKISKNDFLAIAEQARIEKLEKRMKKGGSKRDYKRTGKAQKQS